MITRALFIHPDSKLNHDWTFGKGRQNYLRGDAAIAQSVKTRLMSFLGDCFFAPDAGIDWWWLMGGKDHASLFAKVRSVILGTEGVMRITNLDTSIDPETRHVHIRYEIDTLYSRAYASDVEISTAATSGR